jgi:ABC-type antimicrobial peptide transport system permease subunit
LYLERGRIEGATEAPMLDWEVAGPGYFEAAGIRIVRGRGFEPGDVAGAPYVVVVNETLARRYFPDRDPIGLSISGESPDGPWRRVIGIVADVRQQGLDAAPRPHMYIAHGQAFAFGTYQIVVATEPGAELDTATMRGIIRTVDASAVSGTVRPLGELVAASLAASRLAVTLVAVFAGLATLLAVAGTWGVISLVGRSRQQEWAVRSALGASRRQIVGAAARAGGLPVVTGLTVGFGLALLGGRWLSGELYGLSAWEPRVLAAVLATLLAVTTVVVILPARRASRVDPASVFRE